jgi:hypothetical protein
MAAATRFALVVSLWKNVSSSSSNHSWANDGSLQQENTS